MPIKDFIIINIPVWVFIILAGASILLSFFINGIIKFVFFAFAWWCLCGGFFVFTDFNRKKKIYFKIIHQSKRNSERLKKLTLPLRETFCGMALSLAINHRVKSLMN